MCVCCENVRHDFVAQTFFTYCTSSAQIAPSFAKKRNDPKCTQTLRNSQKHEFWVQWGGIGAFVAKMYNMTSWHEHFSLIAPIQLKLHRVSYSNGTIPNAPKHYETHPKMNLLSNRLDQVRSLQNYPTRPRGTYFFQLCHQFNPNCIEFRTVTKRSKMHPNTTKLTKT